jgi:mannitol-1-/sugar-/sorbitol-6-phosphatase
MTQFSCEAILFDLDGVLVDSTKSVVVIWTAWSEKNGIPPAKTLDVIHGRRTIDGLRILAPHLDLEAETQKIESAITMKKEGTVAIPGAASLLSSLPKGRWCVVTSGLKEFARIRLKDANLPIPEILVSADDVTKGKPDPEPYLKGAQLLNMDPAKCIVIEDAPNGIRAGRAAGIRVIGVGTTYPVSELKEADAVAKTMEGISASSTKDRITIRVE